MIVLDTHAWIWWVSNPENLSDVATDAINKAIPEMKIHVSSISVWEVALLVARGRLKLTLDVSDWVAKSESLPFLTFIPVNNNIVMKSVQLPGPFHKDPADRIIIATALSIGGILISKDDKMKNYPHVNTLW